MSDTVGSQAWQLAFNETGGFSADSSSLVFTSDFETHNFWSNQIYRYDLNSGAITRLTRGNSYNEHPRYSPDGQVLWMTNADNPSHGTDWWTMSPDGSNPQRLSDFNANDNAKTIGQNGSTRPSYRPPIGAPTTAPSSATWKPTC